MIGTTQRPVCPGARFALNACFLKNPATDTGREYSRKDLSQAELGFLSTKIAVLIRKGGDLAGGFPGSFLSVSGAGGRRGPPAFGIQKNYFFLFECLRMLFFCDSTMSLATSESGPTGSIMTMWRTLR